MKQFWAWVWITLTAILIIVMIIWIVKLASSKTKGWENKILDFLKETINTKKIRKKLKEKKDAIINPNIQDTSADEDFQEVIETAVAEKNEEEKNNIENSEKESTEKITSKKEKTDEKTAKKDDETTDEENEASIFDDTTSMNAPSTKNLDEKEKKQIERITLDATNLKNEWKYDDYEKKIIEGLAIDPTNLELTKMLADFYFVTWSYKKSLSLLKKIIERSPEDHKSLWQIWEIYFINGDTWTAELLVDKAVNLKPDSPKYNLSLVEIYYNTDRIMEAISCMEKVTKLRPTNTNYLFTLAKLYEELGDEVNAKKNYFTILEFEPGNEQAKKKLRQLSN